MADYIEERWYYPDGCEVGSRDFFAYRIGVLYRGNGKFMVAPNHEGNEQLSRTGKWLWLPLKMTAMKWCRFSFEEACEAAERAVTERKVSGFTFAEWQTHISKLQS